MHIKQQLKADWKNGPMVDDQKTSSHDEGRGVSIQHLNTDDDMDRVSTAMIALMSLLALMLILIFRIRALFIC